MRATQQKLTEWENLMQLLQDDRDRLQAELAKNEQRETQAVQELDDLNSSLKVLMHCSVVHPAWALVIPCNNVAEWFFRQSIINASFLAVKVLNQNEVTSHQHLCSVRSSDLISGKRKLALMCFDPDSEETLEPTQRKEVCSHFNHYRTPTVQWLESCRVINVLSWSILFANFAWCSDIVEAIRQQKIRLKKFETTRTDEHFCPILQSNADHLGRCKFSNLTCNFLGLAWL